MPGPVTSACLTIARALVLTAALALPGHTQSATTPDYSARAVHTLPDGTKSDGKVVKSGSNMRFEYTEGGREVVQIIRQAEGVIYLLDPASQIFFETRGTPSPDSTGVGYLAPCQEGDPTLSCTRTGTSKTSGVTVEIWNLTRPGTTETTTILWDGLRHKALRQTFPDGAVVDMTFRAMEEIAGRRTEHWTISYAAPGQSVRTGDWYYDPALRVEVREVMPTGEIRSLEDIQVAPVDPTLFQVPESYSRLDMTAPPETGK